MCISAKGNFANLDNIYHSTLLHGLIFKGLFFHILKFISSDPS